MKKRILAIVLSIVMILGAMSFSASATPPISYASGLNDTAHYLLKLPEKEALSNPSEVTGTNFTGTMRVENGERFLVYNETTWPGKITAGGIDTRIYSNMFTYGDDVVGVPDSIPFPTTGGVEDASTMWIAIRMKFNDYGAAYSSSPASLRFYIRTATRDNNLDDGITYDASGAGTVLLSDTKKAAKWLDLNDGSMTWFYPSSGNGVSDAVGQLDLKGHMDGYLMIPFAAHNAKITAEQLRKAFAGFTMRFYNGAKATAGLDIKSSSWAGKELMIGDSFILTDPQAFQTARTQGITKYAPNGYEDTAYYAFRVGGYRTLYYGLQNKSNATHYNKDKYDPTLAGENDRAVLHTTTLSNGDRAVEIIVNKKKDDPTTAVEYEGKTVALTAWDTYDHFRDGTEKNYRMQTGKGLPAEISKDKIKYVAFRLATKDGTVANEACYFNISIGEQHNTNTSYPVCYYLKSETDYTFIDINTNKVSKISTTADKGLKVEGEIDGYLIAPIEDFVDANGNSIPLEELETGYGFYPNNERPSATVMLYDGFGNGKALYYGDNFFVNDVVKFQQYHCAHANMTQGTIVAPTCQNEGYTPWTCDDCGYVQKRDMQGVVACQFTVPVGPQTATCTQYGFDSANKCVWCGEIDDASMVNRQPMLPHDSNLVCERVPATCMKTGTEAGKKCSICGTVQEGCDEIPLRTHDSLQKSEKIVVDEIPATCLGGGTAAGYKCPWCQEVIEGCTPIPVAACNNFKVVDPIPADCQQGGFTEGRKCSWCDTLQSGCEPIEKLEHDKKINVPAVPSTCEKAGTTAGKRCSMCGEISEGCGEQIRAEHKFVKIGTVAPTEDNKGYDNYQCSVCDYIEPRNWVDRLKPEGEEDEDIIGDDNEDNAGDNIGNDTQDDTDNDDDTENNIGDDEENSAGHGGSEQSPITGENALFLVIMIVLCLGAAAVLFFTRKRTTK